MGRGGARGSGSPQTSSSGEGVGSLTGLWGRDAKVRNQEETQISHVQSRHFQETITEITFLEITM